MVWFGDGTHCKIIQGHFKLQLGASKMERKMFRKYLEGIEQVKERVREAKKPRDGDVYSKHGEYYLCPG